MIFLPDTNVFSRYLRGRAEDVPIRDRLDVSLAACRLSAIVLMELEYGAAKRPEIAAFRERIARLQAAFPRVEAFGDAAARHTGRVRGVRDRTIRSDVSVRVGKLGNADALIDGVRRVGHSETGFASNDQ